MTRDEFLKVLPDLIKGYQPAPEVLSKIRKITFIIIIGPSGAGKSTLISKSGVTFVPSDTTRQPRPGEKEGRDFFFLKDYQKIVDDIKNGRFVQIALGATGDLYGSRASSYPESGVATLPVMADVVPIFRRLGFRETVSAFIVPPSYEEWMRRLKTHPITDEQLAKRLAEAQRSLKFALSDSETHFILNEDIAKAESQIHQLLKGKADAEREEQAKKTAKVLLDSIN